MSGIRYTWHEAKRQANLRKHGYDFRDAERVFTGPTMTLEDTREYPGERRFNTTGFLGTSLVVIGHTETEAEIHVISMRKATPYEIKALSQYC